MSSHIKRKCCLSSVLLGLLIAGCGSEDDAQSRLTMASAMLQGIPTGHGTIPAQETTRDLFKEVRELLQPVLTDGLPAEQAAAHLIISETQMSDASAKIRGVSDLEREALSRLMEIETTLSNLRVLESRRTLAEAFSADEERQTFTQQRD